MRCFFATLASQLSFFRGQVASSQITLSEGNARCRCLEQSALQPHNNAELAQDYGISCRSHDDATCTNNMTSFCVDEWCYVDAEACNLPISWSLLTPGRPYSYETCGYIDRFKSYLLEAAVENMALNVVFMTNSGGWKGSYCSSLESSSCKGPMVSFWTSILARSASTTVVATLNSSNFVTGAEFFPPQVMRQVLADNPTRPSIFTACVIATGMGYVDICVAAFTITPARRQLSNMIVVVSEPVVLVVKMEKQSASIRDLVAAGLRPLTPVLWIVLFATFLAIAVTMVLQERSLGGSFEEVSFSKACQLSIYQALGTILGVASYEPTNSGSKLTVLSLGFIMFFFVTAYTANLASMLVVGSLQTTEINSINDAIRMGKVCLAAKLAPGLELNSGISVEAMLPKSSRADVLPGVVSGECVAAVMKREDLDMLHSAGEFCSMDRVGDVLFSVGTGVPVSDRVHRSMALMFTRGEAAGDLADATQLFEQTSRCEASALHIDSLPLESFLGPFIVTAALLVAGLFTTLSERCPCRRRGLEVAAGEEAEEPKDEAIVDASKEIDGDGDWRCV